MESRQILDSAITASSFYSEYYKPWYGRLNLHLGRCAWTTTSGGRDNAWIQVDLGDIKLVTGVATQGRCTDDERVTSYTVTYSIDGGNWEFYKESDGPKVGLCTFF